MGDVSIQRQARDDDDEHGRTGAADAQPGRKLIHSADQLLLLLLHVVFSAIQE